MENPDLHTANKRTFIYYSNPYPSNLKNNTIKTQSHSMNFF